MNTSRETTSSRSPHGFRTRLEGQAYGLGFDLVGVTDLGEPASVAHFDAWLDSGYHGGMSYMESGAELRRDARRPHPGATHAIVVGMHYGGGTPSGPVARYARGDDYHELMRARLRELHAWLQQELGVSIDARPYVDSGPLLERDLGQRAGIGWIGKNTCLINPRQGSWFFIGALVVNVTLPIDAPFAADHCGTCTRCLDACPTDAFVSARVLDATRCISYLTIELRDDIPEALRPFVSDSLYGCDICQEVCPWNVSFARDVREPAFAPRAVIAGKDLRTLAHDILAIDDDAFRVAFKGSAMKRAKRQGLARNAAVVLGNVGTADDVPLLEAALAHDEPLLREHAAWAVARLTALRSDGPLLPSQDTPSASTFPGMTRPRIVIAVRPLRSAPDAGLSTPGTAVQRLALVETLTAEAWALAGHRVPTYARADAPVRVGTLRPVPAVRERSSDC